MFAFAPVANAGAPPARPIEEASKSIVMIEAKSPSGRSLRGAGFVYDSEGRIATAFHVVDGAAVITVEFRDGRKATAHVLAKDGPFDLALLRADAPVNAAPLQLEASTPDIGARVIAIGNPFGHGFSVSAGIVSGHDRTYDPATPHGFLQHDAALNPGSSGGPLLDEHTRVVGINATIPNGRRSDVGVGFAIPGAVATRILARLAAKGAIRHGHLGARLRLVDTELAGALGSPEGAIAIEEIEEGGPAQRAGARPGDILHKIDGKALTGLRQVAEAVVGGEPGRLVVLQGLRNRQSLRLEIALGEMPAQPEPRASVVSLPADKGIVFAGGDNAVVKSIAPDSPGAAAGLKAGDTILAVGSNPVSNAKEAVAVLHAHTGASLALLVKRSGLGARYVVLTGKADAFSSSPLEGNREIETSLPF